MATKKGLLERLAEGPVIGDGGFCFGLEKRGYVRAGEWIPSCTVRHPDAVRQLHRDFLRAGSDVMQSFNFNTAESCLEKKGPLPTGREMNLAAYKLAKQVADEGNALVTVSLSPTVAYGAHRGKAAVQQELRDQLTFFKQEACDIDFIICEYYSYIEEMEWAIEVAKESCLPVVSTMCIGPVADKSGVSSGECAVRMAKAGADVVGANCKFGPLMTLKTLTAMKQELDKHKLNPFLISQPLGFFTPEVQEGDGYLHLPEIHFAYEPRTATRFEAQKFAREAYELGVRYIGGCCGVEPYHIRAMSEELNKERKKVAPITEEYGDILSGIREHPNANITVTRGDVNYWKDMIPGTGRPYSSAFSPLQESATVKSNK